MLTMMIAAVGPAPAYPSPAHEQTPLLISSGSSELAQEEEEERSVSSFSISADGEQHHHDDDDDGDGDDYHRQTVLEVVSTAVNVVEHAVENVVETVVEHVSEAMLENNNTMSQVVETLAEDLVEEIHQVQADAMEELHQAHDGELIVLEMGLSRGLSILPEELQVAADNFTNNHYGNDGSDDDDDDDTVATVASSTSSFLQVESGTHQDEDKNEKTAATETAAPATIPLSAYIGLASAVVSLSAIGPLMELQDNATGSIRTFWRMFGTSLMLFPLACRDLWRDGFPRLTVPQWTTFFLCTVCYLGMTLLFVLSLPLTSIGNAVILSNSQAIMLLLGNLLVGAPITLFEACGAVAAFSGAILCSKDSANGAGTDAADATTITIAAGSDDDDHPPWSTLAGDGLALLAGLCGCGYLVLAKSVRLHMGLFLFTWSTMYVGCVLCLLFQIYALKETVTFDMSTSTGVFGFLSLQIDRLPVELCIVLICNIFGTMGYIQAMQYFDSLIISVAGLCEPVTAEFLAFTVGVSTLPGTLGWIGNLLVAAGTLAVVWPSNDSGKSSSSYGH